jgi:lipoate synthase
VNCQRCFGQIEQERLSLNLKICKICAFKIKPVKLKGYMEWSHKTAPVMRVTDPESFAQFKKDIDRKGQSSILRSKMVSAGRLI